MSNKITTLKSPPVSGGDFETTPAGVYLARCYRMIDLGTQTEVSVKFGTKTARKIILYWELLQNDDGEEVFMADNEKVFSVSQEYVWSMHQKANLRKALQQWRGQSFTEEEASGFEISKLLGVYCKIQVVHNESDGRTYANVGSIMSTNKEAKGHNELIAFSIEDPDMGLFESFSDYLKQRIIRASEWQQVASEEKIEEGDIVDGKVEVQPEGVTLGKTKKLPF